MVHLSLRGPGVLDPQQHRPSHYASPHRRTIILWFALGKFQVAADVLLLLLWPQLSRQQSFDRPHRRVRNDLGDDQEGSREFKLLQGDPKDCEQVQIHVPCHDSTRWWRDIHGVLCTTGMEDYTTCGDRTNGSDDCLSLQLTFRPQSAYCQRRRSVCC